MQTFDKPSVLVVDDERQVLVAVEDVLAESFRVLTAESAERALETLALEREIAVVVTDQRMPRMTGDELLVRMRDTTTAVSILLTGFADLGAVINAVNEGRIFAYVTKPWNPEDLRLKVGKAAEHFELARDLAHERRLLHDLMDSAADAIYFKDTQSRFLRVNRAFLDHVGGDDVASIGGKRLADLGLDRETCESMELEETEALSSGRSLTDRLRRIDRGGRTRWLSSTIAPIRADGRVIGSVTIARDVTKQKELEQQFAQSQKMEAIGLLAGGVAHDFNNLLAVISSYGELALRELPEHLPARADISEMLDAAGRAASLTQQLLAFSRRQVVNPSVLDLNALVSRSEGMLRRILGEDIELVVRLSPALGRVNADAGQIDQIIVNLSVNARDAMLEGGQLTIATADVELDEHYAADRPDVTPGSYVVLSVADTGAGIDAETQARMFEPFFTTKEVGKGTGLGLSTVYGIVTQAGGHVGVRSALGSGTELRLYFPRVEDALQGGAHPATVPLVASGGANVLVVEDDDAVRRIATRILRQAGYEVVEARSGSEAMALCGNGGVEFDLLLTDIVMPGIGGPRLAEELLASYPRLRVLYMSGYPGGASRQGKPLGAGQPLLAKPFTPASLLEKVREVLAGPPGRAPEADPSSGR